MCSSSSSRLSSAAWDIRIILRLARVGHCCGKRVLDLKVEENVCSTGEECVELGGCIGCGG